MLSNAAYHGELKWGRRVTRDPETGRPAAATWDVVKRIDGLGIVPEPLWKRAQEVNKRVRARTWRTPDGRHLKSRPFESPWLLSPFLQCALCHGPTHVNRSGSEQAHYVCTRHASGGRRACQNTRMLPQKVADKIFLGTFGEALIGAEVINLLTKHLEAIKPSAVNPGAIRREIETLRAENERLVEQIAKGGLRALESDINARVSDRKARLEHLRGLLLGSEAGRFDVKEFGRRVTRLMDEWRGHLEKLGRKNLKLDEKAKGDLSVAQQVLGRILPERIRMTPPKKGSRRWTFQVRTDYSMVLDEIETASLSAYKEILKSEIKDFKSEVKRERIGRPCSRRSGSITWC